MPVRSERGDLYSFVLDLNADGYDTKDIAINTVEKAQVWHRRLGHLHVCTELGYSTQARGHKYHIRAGCLGLRRLRRGEGSTACSPPNTDFPSVLRRPDGVLNAKGHRQIQARQQGRRVHRGGVPVVLLYFETDIIQEFVTTNTPHQIGVS